MSANLKQVPPQNQPSDAAWYDVYRMFLKARAEGRVRKVPTAPADVHSPAKARRATGTEGDR